MLLLHAFSIRIQQDDASCFSCLLHVNHALVPGASEVQCEVALFFFIRPVDEDVEFIQEGARCFVFLGALCELFECEAAVAPDVEAALVDGAGEARERGGLEERLYR